MELGGGSMKYAVRGGDLEWDWDWDSESESGSGSGYVYRFRRYTKLLKSNKYLNLNGTKSSNLNLFMFSL